MRSWGIRIVIFGLAGLLSLCFPAISVQIINPFQPSDPNTWMVDAGGGFFYKPAPFETYHCKRFSSCWAISLYSDAGCDGLNFQVTYTDKQFRPRGSDTQIVDAPFAGGADTTIEVENEGNFPYFYLSKVRCGASA